jgi:hypothetical protein
MITIVGEHHYTVVQLNTLKDKRWYYRKINTKIREKMIETLINEMKK